MGEARKGGGDTENKRGTHPGGGGSGRRVRQGWERRGRGVDTVRKEARGMSLRRVTGGEQTFRAAELRAR